MTDIPHLTSPAVAYYIHKFVEWDKNQERYVSTYCKEKTKDKKSEIQDVILVGADLVELTFLYLIEEDPLAKKMIKKSINVWKQT